MNNTAGLLVFISPVLYNAMNEEDVLNQFLNLFRNWSRKGVTYIGTEEQNVIDRFIFNNPTCRQVLDELMTENKEDIIDENLVVYEPKELAHVLSNVPDTFKGQRFVMIHVD